MTTKKAKKKPAPRTARNVVVETPLPDGWVSMHVGRLVKHTSKTITLVDASWIAHTGRRSEFFAGVYGPNCEIEPLPDGVSIELPAPGAILTDWPRELPRKVR